MAKKFTQDRRNQLAQLIIASGKLSVSEAAERFQVSTETIRKDLMALEAQGLVKKSYGGAIPTTEVLEKPLPQVTTSHYDQKQEIAAKALSLIPKNGVVILDAGSTNLALARLLRLEKGLTIFTNSASAVSLLADSDNKVFIFGGQVRFSSLAFIGQWTNEQIAGIHGDVAFIGTDGFRDFTGPSTASYEESEVKRNMLKAADTKVILADSSKFDIPCFFQFASWEDVDYLITDSQVTEAQKTQLHGAVTIL